MTHLNPQRPEPRESDYFSAGAVAARGREAVAALGYNPVVAVETASTRVIELVERTPAEAPIGSPAGTMTLAQYLPSRIAELTIHSLDIARAAGVELTAPTSALRESLMFVARRAATRSGQDILLALTGRGQFPPGYSVY